MDMEKEIAHHSPVTAIFTGAPDSVLAGVRPIHAVGDWVKI